MIKIPSYSSAIIYGAIGMPIFIFLFKFLENTTSNQFIIAVWFVIGFGLPLLLSTGDFKYIKSEINKGRSFVGPWTKSQDFKEFFFPAWKRMFVCFLAICISLLFLNLVGLDLSY